MSGVLLIVQTSQHFEELGGNPKKGFLVGGVSSGANFATVISHLYRDDKLSPPLTGVYLAAPPIVSANSVPRKYKSVWLSREQNKNATLLNVESIRMFDGKSPSSPALIIFLCIILAGLYDPDWESPLFCPLLFESHKNLPPTYFQVCGMDPFRDDGFIYERVLREDNGIKTKIDVYPGLPHAFWTFFTRAGFTKKLYEDSVKGLAWLLEQSVTYDTAEGTQIIGSPKPSRTATETAEAESVVDKLQVASVTKGKTATREQKEEGTMATSSSAANYANSEGGIFSRALYRCPEIMELMRLIVKKNPGDLSLKVKSFVDSLKEEEAWKRQNT
jgi:acetyl esterase/lipase